MIESKDSFEMGPEWPVRTPATYSSRKCKASTSATLSACALI